MKTEGELAKQIIEICGEDCATGEQKFEIVRGLIWSYRQDIREELLKPPDLPDNFAPCPKCGSSYFNSYKKDGKTIYHCKGHYKQPHNEYSGCSYTWEDGEK